MAAGAVSAARFIGYAGHRRLALRPGHRLAAVLGEPLQLRLALLELQPADLATLIWLGRLQLDRGETADAEASFTKAYAQSPGTVAVLAGLGRVAVAKRDYASAAARLRRETGTLVTFAEWSQPQLDLTGLVAGAFTVDGLGGPFVTAVAGDPHAVVGLSLPLLRELLAEKVEAIAICLINSFANPAHELMLRDVVRRKAPGLREREAAQRLRTRQSQQIDRADPS